MAMVWMEDRSYQLPELPEELELDPLLAGLLHVTCFLEFSDEQSVNPDDAVEAMESMAFYLQRLKPAQKKQINEQLKRVVAYAKKQKWEKDVVKSLKNFLTNAFVE